MSATVPFFALFVLIALSFGAKSCAAFVTSAGRQYMTGALAASLLVSSLMFG